MQFQQAFSLCSFTSWPYQLGLFCQSATRQHSQPRYVAWLQIQGCLLTEVCLHLYCRPYNVWLQVSMHTMFFNIWLFQTYRIGPSRASVPHFARALKQKQSSSLRHVILPNCQVEIFFNFFSFPALTLGQASRQTDFWNPGFVIPLVNFGKHAPACK